MFKELAIAVILTMVFSVGVGVLFVRTLLEMAEVFLSYVSSKNETTIKQKILK